MSVDNLGDVRHVTRAEWDALRTQWERVSAENAEVRAHARAAQAMAMERRLVRDGGRPGDPMTVRAAAEPPREPRFV